MMAKHETRLAAAWTAVWPGLPALWQSGSWLALIVALVFSNLFAVAILATVVWPDLLPAGAKAVVCFSVASIWAVSAVRQFGAQLSHRKDLRASGDLKHLFRRAQTEYLQRNWFQVETLLGQLLSVHPEDDAARMLLATSFRRLGRKRDAMRELDAVEQVSGKHRWAWEIKEERRLLALPFEAKVASAEAA